MNTQNYSKTSAVNLKEVGLGTQANPPELHSIIGLIRARLADEEAQLRSISDRLLSLTGKDALVQTPVCGDSADLKAIPAPEFSEESVIGQFHKLIELMDYSAGLRGRINRIIKSVA